MSEELIVEIQILMGTCDISDKAPAFGRLRYCLPTGKVQMALAGSVYAMNWLMVRPREVIALALRPPFGCPEIQFNLIGQHRIMISLGI
jgi:hypothetical protein